MQVLNKHTILGLMTQSEPNFMTEDEIRSLLNRPGFDLPGGSD